MSDKKLYTVMVEFSVESDSLYDANDYVGGFMNRGWPKGESSHILQAEVQFDHETDNSGQRVFYAHPEDSHAEEDLEEYEARRDGES